jgi:hypothetical protein
MDWIAWAKEAGAYISPLLMGAVIWQERERLRLLDENKALTGKVEALAERIITVATRLDQFLFNERKA